MQTALTIHQELCRNLPRVAKLQLVLKSTWSQISGFLPTTSILNVLMKICPCSTMYMIHPVYLMDVLELVEGEIPNQIMVPKDARRFTACS